MGGAMSSITINGDTSGSVILQAPAVSGSTTLTLPTTSGTLVTSNAMPTGSVLQVVSVTATSNIATNSTTYQDTPLVASITPSSSSNKILVMTMAPGTGKNGAADYAKLQLLRGATTLSAFVRFGLTDSLSPANFQTANFIYLDSPATTSSTTYKVQFAAGTTNGVNYYNVDSQVCSITLMEIKG